MSFIERLINVKFILGKGAYGESGADTVELAGLRVSAKIIKAGGPSMGTAQVQVFGMTLSQMNQLSTLGMAITLDRKNTVVLTAGDELGGMATVFVGQITNAWGNFQAAPDVPFQVEAHVGSFEAVKASPPLSYKGSADVAVIMQGLATLMGLSFENNGVQVKLANPYFPGSLREQAKACAEAAGIGWIIDNEKLAIWPAGQPRNGAVPLISPATGMKGYPSYSSKGIVVQTLFNPSVGFGGAIEVQSQQTPACGRWIVFSLMHDLESKTPGGQWHSTIGAARPGLGPIVA